MLKNYFLIAYRNLVKNKLYTGINLTGLTIGLTASLLIGLFISHELSYDQFHKNKDRIVRVTMEYSDAGTVNTTATTGTKVGPQFKRTFPLVEEYVRTFISHNVVKAGELIVDEPRILYADPTFFRLFSFRILEGDAATALDAPDKIALSVSMAKKYFGNQNPLNKTITSGRKDLIVSAIYEDVPQNSQLKFDFVTQFLNLGNNIKEETWWNANWITYLQTRDNKSIPQLQALISDYMKSSEIKSELKIEGSDYLTYHLEPLDKVHLYSTLAGFEPNGSIRFISMFAIIALLILVIACANYTNLAIAQSSGRSGEIGIRKVIGALRSQVFFQFIGESTIITLIGTLLAFGLGLLLLPYFNEMTGKAFKVTSLLSPVPVLELIAVSLVLSLLAGLYPALILSGTQIISILKKGFSFTGGNNLLRKSLIVIQFGISVFLILFTIIILQQMKFMQTKDLGFDRDHVLVLPIGGKMMDNFELLKTACTQIKGVESMTAAYETPEFVEWGDGIEATDEKGNHKISLNAMPVDLDFIKTLKMNLVAGRDFIPSDFAMMDTNNASANYHVPYIINESLARKIGWSPEQALGRIIEKSYSGPVLGVVKDFNFSSLHDPIGPLVMFLGRDFSRTMMLRINGNDIAGTLGRIEMMWKQRIPDRPFVYHFLDEDFNKLYEAEQRTSKLFFVAAGIAILLAALGLFGLVAFSIMQRTKEIGIRRVLGARMGDITLLIANNFLILISFSILIAIPLAWWVGEDWLKEFAFRIPLKIDLFVYTALGIILLALCTIGFHTIKSSLANPVKSLRSE